MPDKVFIIAEMGVNHNGHLNTAKELIKAAAAAGVDAVKTQSFVADRLAVKGAQKAKYQREETGEGSQIAMLKALEVSDDMYWAMAEYAADSGVMLFSTPFDIPSVRLLNTLGQRIFKIPSGEITNLPYLIETGRLRKPVIMSTGMAELPEIAAALDVLRKHGTNDITLLHCNTQYPTPYPDANLRAMDTLRQAFGLPVGYSDHTPGITVSVAAAALGATVIEKHFTLDKRMEGPDHKASIEPDELATMVEAIRNVEQALGDGVKRVTDSERENMDIARKSIVAAKDINVGEVFTEENITTKRPGNGVSPMRWFEVLGTTAKRDFAYDELISL